jgi:hypothetical protein
MRLYQHYKGGLYIVTNPETLNATNEAQHGEIFVFYTCLQDNVSFVRPLSEFHENVEYEGRTGPRFRFIADAADIMHNGGHP